MHTRQCLRLVAGTGLSGQKRAAAFDPILQYRGTPEAITMDNGGEFAGRARDVSTY